MSLNGFQNHLLDLSQENLDQVVPLANDASVEALLPNDGIVIVPSADDLVAVADGPNMDHAAAVFNVIPQQQLLAQLENNPFEDFLAPNQNVVDAVPGDNATMAAGVIAEDNDDNVVPAGWDEDLGTLAQAAKRARLR